jgi:phage baseplate assembly protein W
MAIYSDLNQATPRTNPLVTGIDSIYQSITNILSTPTHTRLFNPEFGSELETLLFDPMDDITVSKLFNAVVKAVSKWDNRIAIDYSESNITPIYEENKYELLLVFRISGIEEIYEYEGELIRPS